MEIRKTVRIRNKSTGEMHTIDIWQMRNAEGKRVFGWSEFDGKEKMHYQPIYCDFCSISATLEAIQFYFEQDYLSAKKWK